MNNAIKHSKNGTGMSVPGTPFMFSAFTHQLRLVSLCRESHVGSDFPAILVLTINMLRRLWALRIVANC